MQGNTHIRLTETFELAAPSARRVQLVGDFTDWEQKPINLQRQSDGVWNGTAELESGPHHYRFVVDGRPTCLMIRSAAAYKEADGVLVANRIAWEGSLDRVGRQAARQSGALEERAGATP